MRKAKLIKKDSPAKELLTQSRKARKARQAAAPDPVRTTLEVTTEWLKKRREGPSARETFAALFSNSDPQSA